MKNSDVKIGQTYECKVSARLVTVTVIAQTSKTLIGGKTRTAFAVRNERTGRVLTKSAAALRKPLETATTLRLPPKATQRSMLAIAEVAFEDGGRAAHYGNPGEKSAVRLLAAAGFMVITHFGRDELYAKLTAEGQARLAMLRGIQGPELIIGEKPLDRDMTALETVASILASNLLRSAQREAERDANEPIAPPSGDVIDHMMFWHGGQGSSLYAAASNWLAGHTVPRATAEAARDELERYSSQPHFADADAEALAALTAHLDGKEV